MKLFRFAQVHWQIVLITLLGALLRFTNLNWDAGGRLHPDEALIVNGALSIRWFSNLFPGFHDYNGFSVYLLKLFSFGTTSATSMTLIGRMLSASISTLTIFMIFQLGKKMWNQHIGLLASLFFAFSPLSLQLAHFYTTESIMLFLLTLLAYGCVSFWESPKIKSVLLLGVISGLLVATKNTGYLFLLIPLLTIFSRKKNIEAPLVFGIVTLSLFFLASPYSFLDLHGYLTRSQYLSDVVSGRLLMDWTIQFQKTNAVFWIKNLLLGCGPMVVIGCIGIIKELLPQKKSTTVIKIFAMWSFGFFIFLAFTYLKFIRYSAPLLPFITIFAAKILWDIRKDMFGKALLCLLVLTQMTWGGMFFHIYPTPHTSLTARDWIARHIPAHSVIIREEWNNVIHFDTPPLLGKQYGFISINLYTQPDTKEKYQNLISSLQTADYFISESPKVKNTIQRLSLTYPYSDQFYKNLNNGSLGFKHIVTFTSHPQLGGIIVNDELSEETFSVFDHPTITIYQRK